MLEFDYDIVHRAGVNHQAADALSRLPSDRTDKTLLEDDLPLLIVNTINKKMDEDPLHMSEDMSSTLMHIRSKPKDF